MPGLSVSWHAGIWCLHDLPLAKRAACRARGLTAAALVGLGLGLSLSLQG